MKEIEDHIVDGAGAIKGDGTMWTERDIEGLSFDEIGRIYAEAYFRHKESISDEHRCYIRTTTRRGKELITIGFTNIPEKEKSNE